MLTIEVLLEVNDVGRPKFLISPRHSVFKIGIGALKLKMW
jgi:hypothetical protein